ncbi:GNAT family N-acetyltransferase [Lactiplantibacillus mudanjiangensis]|uniref:N-acetyltransferase [Lactobacillus sp.] n=1 Tax=Lactiplantibacillus mudanjiangensis TaxID=1296538 RepID=A0A660DYS0_9LACO|nr:GNAT family protein [Lactiplantibacillus mudanjiangensis]VDG20342.1 N-acetyltransferase [Lactobacillus sp.] [Lactiplantibacillus mudanjiangensis]VDG23966.1 N-acetyltransferase [Lactobacillus sp.] [Lactiplantibacillus mudanjiangensis]VDG27148.1 N-acetyltransferase [Lactobacillus sp.] [Lactiplantibacillus mudanjiangensis]VDG33948.1 N-acetyltransferase [Lactobacillus sp.] [Lactiplantibacillus mudanjiangensis]
MKNIFMGPKINLAVPQPEDFDEISDWYADGNFVRNLDTAPARPLSGEDLEQTYRNLNRETEFYFHIRANDDDRLLGFVTLYNIDWHNQLGQLAIAIGDAEDRGHGYGTEALNLMLHYGFNELNLYKVCLDVIATNQSAIAVYQNSGFEFEGTNQRAVKRDGQRIDLYNMGLFAEDFQPRIKFN